MPKINSRQKILNYLRKQGTATSPELARVLRVTPANIRHHLGRLLADGLVDVDGVRVERQRGRPQKNYRLSRLAQGDNLAALADGLLAEFIETLPDAEKAQALRRLAGRIMPAPPEGPMPLVRRLGIVVEALSRTHYQAHWEAHAAGPRLIFGQCPYASVIDSHPALCLMDKAMLEVQFTNPVEQLAKLERNERGLPICVFALR
jgi:predicted ArsR family transcriptional regulator